MPAGRRHPPPLPHLSALVPTPKGPQGLDATYNGILQALRKQEVFNRALLDGFSGLPRPHAETHLVGKSDPLQAPGPPLTVLAGGTASIGSGPSYMREDARLIGGVAAPLNPTGQVAAVGSLFTFLRSDCVVKQGIVTTKGDLLTHSATLPDRLPVGADGLALVAASAQALGLTWAAPTAAAHNLLSTVHGDTVPNAALRGALVVGNSSPAWARLAIGAADRVLFSDGTDASWSQVTTGAITDSAVTYAKMQNVSAASRLLGRGTAGGSVVREIILGSGLSMSGDTLNASGGGGGGGWTLTGDLVHLTDAADTVSVGDADAIDIADNKVEVNYGIAAKRYSANPNEPPIFAGYRARGTFGAETPLGADDTVLSIRAWGSGTGGYVLGSEIRFVAEDTYDLGSALAATRIDFHTNAGDGLGADVRVRINPDGAVLGGVLSGTGTLLGLWEIANDLSLHQSAISAKTALDNHLPIETLNISRMRPDGTAPNADFGADVSWYLQGANDSMVQAVRLRGAWEVNQTDDTTARDGYLSLAVVVNNALTERARMTSEGVWQPGSDNVGDLGTSALRWRDAHFSRRVNIGVTSSGGLGLLHLIGSSGSAAEQYVDSFNAASSLIFRRAGGSPGAPAVTGGGQTLGQLQWYAYDSTIGGAYREIARIAPFIANSPSAGNISGDLYFYVRNGTAALDFVAGFDSRGSFVLGNQSGALASAATDGFLYIRTTAASGAAPTGVPSAFSGAAPMIYSDADDILWIYQASTATWKAH